MKQNKVKTNPVKGENKQYTSPQYALVTGATRGIGRAIAEQLAARGYDLLLVARGEKDLVELKSQLQDQYPSAEILFFPADLSDPAQIKQVGDWALQKSPVVFVSNAGIFKPVSLLNEEEDSFLPQFYLNYYAAHSLCLKLGRKMKELRQGHLFIIGSTASRQPVKAGAYTVTKYALSGLTNVLREELRDAGVKLTEIIPGSTRTSSWDGTDHPESRFVRPQEIAQAVGLCLEMGSSTNIEEIVIKPLQGNIVTDC